MGSKAAGQDSDIATNARTCRSGRPEVGPVEFAVERRPCRIYAFGKPGSIKPQNFNAAILCCQEMITASIQYPLIGTKSKSEYRIF